MILAKAFKTPSQQRAASTASLSDGFFASFFGATTATGTTVNSNKALTISAFYNGVDQISSDIAKDPFHIYQRTDTGRERDRKHPADYLISSQPSPLMTSFTWRKMMTQSAIIKGDGFSIILRNAAGNPVQLKYLDYYDVTKVYLHDDQLWYQVKGYQLPVPGSDMIHIFGYSNNGLRGCSVIQYAAASLGISLNAQDFAGKAYDNKAISTGVLETDKEINNDIKPLVAKGFSNAMNEPTNFRTAVLDEGMKYKRISLTPAELQFIETRKDGVIDIARWLNIAPQKLKDMSNASYSSLEFISIAHRQDCLRPWQLRWQQEVDRKMLDVTGMRYSRFLNNAIMSTDAKTRADYFSKAIMMGWMTQNEAREYEDMNTITGHDQLLTPVNTQTLEQIDTKIAKDKADAQQ